MTMPLKELRYAFFGTWLCPKTRFDPINTEHSALCKQDINKKKMSFLIFTNYSSHNYKYESFPL